MAPSLFLQGGFCGKKVPTNLMLELVRDGTRTGLPPNCSDFTRELEASRRAVMLDLDLLRDEENALIAYEA